MQIAQPFVLSVLQWGVHQAQETAGDFCFPPLPPFAANEGCISLYLRVLYWGKAMTASVWLLITIDPTMEREAKLLW